MTNLIQRNLPYMPNVVQIPPKKPVQNIGSVSSKKHGVVNIKSGVRNNTADAEFFRRANAQNIEQKSDAHPNPPCSPAPAFRTLAVLVTARNDLALHLFHTAILHPVPNLLTQINQRKSAVQNLFVANLFD